jgi:hypothetical protein
LKDSTNRTVQIVMKKGLIEIPLTGKLSDFEDCVLVHRSDIDDINKIIKVSTHSTTGIVILTVGHLAEIRTA